MKKHIALSCLALSLTFAASTAYAQDAATTAPATATTPAPTKKSKNSGVRKTSGRSDKELADLSTSLNLTDDQKAKIKPIIDDQEAKMHTVKMDSTLSKDDQKTKSAAIRKDASQQIRSVLTPDQQKTFDGEKHKKKEAAPAAPTA